MSIPGRGFVSAFLRKADPRRSLVTGLIWLVVALASAFALTASLWAGRVAREIVLQQHVRRLVLETDQLGSDLGQAVEARLAAARDSGRSNGAPASGAALFDYLRTNYPTLGWVAVADATGAVAGSDGSVPVGTSVADQPWFSHAASGLWIGRLQPSPAPSPTAELGDLSVAIADPGGRLLAVAAAHLTWRWASHDLQRLGATLDPRGAARTVVLDPTGKVRVGPADLLDRPWPGQAVKGTPPIEPSPLGKDASGSPPRFELLDGATSLVARAPLLLNDAGGNRPWQVQLSEPKDQVYQRANALAGRILWISICLGIATALAGALGARHLTGRLQRLTHSAVQVGHNDVARLEVPTGHDEVAQLGAVFAKVLDDLRQERRELLTLSSELERRVLVRTREVERLAEESRYSAVVRERLKIARDLHDTLAHSMMAMLSEVRLLRRLHGRDPEALTEELARAEEVAHNGLNEARTAITQMRVNVVRDTGLGAALSKALEAFLDRTGIAVEFSADPEAAGFGDERAETLFRMAEEGLRNIEHHAMASKVTVALALVDRTHVTLQVRDDGVGFDPTAAHPGHYGLIGLHEQAQLIDAELCIDSAPQRGTTLLVSLRVAPEML